MTSIPTFRIWCRNHADDITSTDVSRTLWISESSPIPSGRPVGLSAGIRPVVPRAAFIGVVMVPPELEERISLNGRPLWSGMHGLRHADRLDINGHEIWVAASASIEASAYDPAVHGEDVFCFLTKARLCRARRSSDVRVSTAKPAM